MKRNTFKLVMIAAAIFLVYVLWTTEDQPSGSSVVTVPNSTREIGDEVSPATADAKRTGVPYNENSPINHDFSGRVVDRAGNPVAASVTIALNEQHSQLSAQPVLEVVDSSGIIQMLVPSEWNSGVAIAESTDGLRRGVYSWSLAQNLSESVISVGDIVVELSPIVELELHVHPDVVAALSQRQRQESAIEVEAAPRTARAGSALLSSGSSANLHSFTLGGAQAFKAVVRVPASCVDNQGLVRILWRFRPPDGRLGIPLQDDTVDAMAPGALCVLDLGADNLLRGSVTNNGHETLSLTMSVIIIKRTIYSAMFSTDSFGRFTIIVPRSSSGTLWPGLLGQRVEEPWVAGQQVSIDVDLGSFISVAVVSGHEGAVTHCAVKQSNARILRNGAEITGLRFSKHGTFFLDRTRMEQGDRLFITTPDGLERMHACEKEFLVGDGDYIVDLEKAFLPNSSIRILVTGRYANSNSGILSVRLESGDLNARGQRLVYRLIPKGKDWTAGKMFSENYSYRVRKGYDVIMEGKVSIKEDETPTLRIDI